MEGLRSSESERQIHFVYSYAGRSVCNTLCAVLSILYLSVLSTLSYPFAASTPFFLLFCQDISDPNYSYLTFPDLQRATKTQNQNTCSEWSGDDIQNYCHILFDCSVIILTHQVGTDQKTDRRFRNNGEKFYLKTSAIVFLISLVEFEQKG